MTRTKHAGERSDATQTAEISSVRDTRFGALLIVCGFACFWTCVITVLASPAFLIGEGFSFDDFLLRFFFLLGFGLVQFFSYTGFLTRISEEAFQHFTRILSAVLALLFLVLAGAATAGWGWLLPSFARTALWLLFGASSGLFVITWGIVWTQLDAERPDNHTSALNVAASLLLCAALSVFMLFAPSTVSVIVVAVLYLASLLLQTYSARQFPVLESINVKLSRQRLELFSRNMLPPLLTGVVFGTVLAFVLITLSTAAAADGNLALRVLLTSVAVGALAAFLVLALLRRVPRFSTLERFIFPIFGGGLLFLPFTQGTVRTAVLAVLIADAISYFILHWNVLIVLSYRHHLRASFHFGQGLISPLGGTMLGCGITGILVFGLEMTFDTAMLCAALTLVFLLVIVLSVAPYASNKTVEAIAGEIETEAEAQTHDKAGSWKRRSVSVCESYALTPREQEVFLLLAKGRNTEIIAHQLFISTHTVKTHTTRIYRKLCINSQQELIDMMEKS